MTEASREVNVVKESLGNRNQEKFGVGTIEVHRGMIIAVTEASETAKGIEKRKGNGVPWLPSKFVQMLFVFLISEIPSCSIPPLENATKNPITVEKSPTTKPGSLNPFVMLPETPNIVNAIASSNAFRFDNGFVAKSF